MPRILSRRKLLVTVAVALPACGEPPVPDLITHSHGDDDQGDADQRSCDGIVAEGDMQGDVAADWTLEDSLGEQVSLWEHCGDVIFFEEGAFW